MDCVNKIVLFVPIAILILAGPSVVSQAFAATTITMEADKHVYDHTSTIILTGNVYPVDLRGSDITIMCKSPGGAGVCGIYQLSTNSDGDFSVSINTATSLMKKNGIYEFQAKYSSLAEITISVELVNAVETSDSSETLGSEIGTTGTVTAQSGNTLHELVRGQIEYDMTCDADPAFFANSDDNSIIIHLDSTTDGIITLTLHEELIKPFEDGTFAVIVDNQEMQDYTQVGNTLTIPCMAGTEKIEIHGSWAIPEFGVIAAMILTVAIVSIIVITAKTRLSLVPKY